MKIKETINSLIKHLDSREKEVIESRFGLKGEEKTLAAIGEKYNLTRERIRQIESISLKFLRNKMEAAGVEKIVEVAVSELKKFGGLRRDDDFVKDMAAILKDGAISSREMRFLFEISGKPKFRRDDKNFFSFWHLDDESLETAFSFIKKFMETLKNKKKEIIENKKFNFFFKETAKAFNLNEKTALNYLSVSKRIVKNPFGDYGLSDWEEVNPLTVKSKIHLLLKRHKKPLHFREITERVNKAGFDKRGVLHRTVHNELIKDPRFVLVGRGTYGLAELGYKPGTAKDVIARILKTKGAMPKEKVVDLVLQERFLRPNTILLNLQNRKFFKRLPNGKYHLK